MCHAGSNFVELETCTGRCASVLQREKVNQKLAMCHSIECRWCNPYQKCLGTKVFRFGRLRFWNICVDLTSQTFLTPKSERSKTIEHRDLEHFGF
jgi:hypothetical protein